MIPFSRCDGCDRDLPLGATKYRVLVTITSDFDGYLPDYGDSAHENTDDLLDELNLLTEEEAEDQVHQEIRLTLCRSCRDKLIDDMAPYSDGNVETRSKAPIRLQ
jgi:hypothetical protein